jgi:DNA-directed RNA polymerase specialized sigma24 family protein
MSGDAKQSESVTGWVQQLRQGDPEAAQKLWERYFTRLVREARATLQGAQRRVADEEDVALSAFASFCRGIEQQRFPRLTDRDDLWHLLVAVTAHKARDLVTRERRLKRGGGKVRGDSAFVLVGDGEEWGGIDAIIGDEPTPAFAAQVAEECRLLLDALTEEPLRQIALWKFECFTHEEIAEKLGCSVATVDRKVQRIRRIQEKRQRASEGQDTEGRMT